MMLVCEHPEMYPLSQMDEVAARGYRAMRVVAHIFHSLQDYARYV